MLALGHGHRVTFDWDAEGRLATTTLDGTPTSYDYNGTEPMGDWTGTAFATGQTQSRRHVFGAGGDPLYRTVGGVATYSHQDILGSTAALSNATASPVGGVAAVFNYDPYGQPIVPVTSTFGYAGQRLEQTTGLVYDGARFYSPALGRFNSPDPIGYAGGNNLYAYVGNDPLNNTDPSGLSAQQVGSNDWALTATSSLADLTRLDTELLAARLTGNQNLVNRIQVQIDNIQGATSGSSSRVGGGGVASVVQDTPFTGIVYSRMDLNGNILPYGGQAQSEARFLQRQIEHARNYPNADFQFNIVARANPGVDLDIAEYQYIQQLTGGVRASKSPVVSNLKDPVGPPRRPSLGLPEPRAN